MRRTLFISAVCAGLIALGGASAAAAVDNGDESVAVPSPSATAYPAPTPTAPTLAGSTLSPRCLADVPWIDYSVTLVDPSGAATAHTAYLDLTDGTNTVTLTLGEVASNGTLSGRVLWPGASVENGVGTGWPGWAYENGAWVATSGNYAWTRGDIQGTIRVNPDLAVAISYPQATPQCASAPTISGSVASVAGALPATGGDLGAVLWPALGGAALLGGGVLIAVRAARSKHSER